MRTFDTLPALALLMGMGTLLATCPASATQQAPADPATAQRATTPGAPDGASHSPQKIRCQSLSVTGSRFSKRICHTEEEWKALEDGARTFMRDIESTRVSPPRQEGGGM
jgi:hypothetical protein